MPPLTRRTLLAASALAASAGPAGAQDGVLVVFAAASLKNALDAVAAAFAKEPGGRRVAVSYAASSALARQIEAGAPADIFISADLDWMDELAKGGLVRPETRTNLLGNELVLIGPKDGPASVALAPGIDLAAALRGGRLATAQTRSVPAGKYGRAALEALGAWDGVKNRLAEADNVRAALLLVSRGEAPLGIVYRTDAAADPEVRVVATFPADTHPAIVYPAAATRRAGPEADRFLAFLRSPAARRVFEGQGFVVLPPSAPPS